MAKAKQIAHNPELDPTMPKIEIKLGDKSYFLCFTFSAIALAEAKLRAAGTPANLIHALDLSTMDASKIVPLFYAALISHQPDIKPEVAASLVTMKNLGTIFQGIADAYIASLSDPEETAKTEGKGQPE
jgi:hypothetical protein